jgi:multidrug resistance efflux pump
MAAIALRERDVAGAGQKEELLVEARSRLGQLRELAQLQRRMFERMERMREGSFVSDQDLEFVEAELIRLEGEVVIAEAQVQVLETGERLEERKLAEARLEAALAQLEALERQRSELSVRTPISGVVARPVSDSVLVAVRDTSEWIVATPVDVRKLHMVRVGQAMEASGAGLEPVSGVITQIDDSVAMVAGLPMVLVVSRLDAEDASLRQGLTVTASFERGPVRLRDYLVEQLNSLFQWRSWLNSAA